MWTDDRIQSIIEQALADVSADEADASLYVADRNISRFAESSLRQNMSEFAGQLTIRAFSQRRAGVASTSSLDIDSIRRTAQMAGDMARNSEEIEHFAGLYAGEGVLPSVPAHDAETAALSPIEKARTLRKVFDAGRQHDARFAGTWTTIDGALATANSHGVRRLARFTTADALFIALRGKRSGYATQMARRAAQLDVEALAEEATEKSALLADEEIELEPGTYDVILEPAALAEIFEWLSMIAFSGRAFEDGSSFFVGKRGEHLLGSNVTVADDATDDEFLPFPFDLEGRPKRRVELIADGIIRTPVVDTLFATLLGLEPTGSCSDLSSDDHGMPLHLSMSGGESTRDELIASSERAIWVTRFHYINGLLEPKIALMTGTTRDGTFLIENGRVTRRLANLRWTQSIVQALQNVVALTRTRRAIGTWWNPIGGTIAPTVKVRGWRFTGVQKR
jgi:predicted Zn-dependent protease